MKSHTEVVTGGHSASNVAYQTLDIHGRIKRNPYAMVAGALGIGFILGGGLFTRLAAKIFGTGLRIGLMAALPILRKELALPAGETKLNRKKETDQ